MTTRKLFLSRLYSSALVVAVGGLAACGGGDEAAPAPGPAPTPGPPGPPGPPPPPAPTTCAAFVFSANHGHALTIPAADLDSTTPKTYSVQGTSGHDHMVTLMPGQLAILKAGGIVNVTTTDGGGHNHQMGGGCT